MQADVAEWRDDSNKSTQRSEHKAAARSLTTALFC